MGKGWEGGGGLSKEALIVVTYRIWDDRESLWHGVVGEGRGVQDLFWDAVARKMSSDNRGDLKQEEDHHSRRRENEPGVCAAAAKADSFVCVCFEILLSTAKA